MPKFCFTEVILAPHCNMLCGMLANVLIQTPSLFYFGFDNGLRVQWNKSFCA